MAKRYFKVVIKVPLEIPLTLEDQRSAPNHYIVIQEYQERIIEVEYSLPKTTKMEDFEKLIKKCIRLNYKNIHSIAEYFFPDETKLPEHQNEDYGKV